MVNLSVSKYPYRTFGGSYVRLIFYPSFVRLIFYPRASLFLSLPLSPPRLHSADECQVTTLIAEVGEPSTFVFPLPTADKPLRPSASASWHNYVVGIVHNFSQHPRFAAGPTLPAFRCVIASDVPIGGGLSR